MKTNNKLPLLSVMIVGLLILLILQSCSLTDRTDPLVPTLTALSAAMEQTLTAVSNESQQTHSLATAESVATVQSQQILATQTAEIVVEQQNQEATSVIAGPVLAELPEYGVDPANGQLGWLHDPLTLGLTGYHEFKYGNDHMNVTAADFVLAGDLTMDTQYGGSGCGFMFRSNGNQKNPDQYMVLATRFASGHVVFLALKDGEIANFHDFYPRTEDGSFSAESGATNRLAVAARGNIIEIYTNGVKIGEVDTTQPPKRPALPAAPKIPADLKDSPALNRYKSLKQEYDEIVGVINSNFQIAMKNYQNRQAIYSDGFLGMVALSESGETNCNFNNTWLWLINPE